jgi:methylmalonyl-CoA mutase
MSTAREGLPRTRTEPAEAPLRFVSAASLFDGHDAAINIIRRLLQQQGAEVIHLGHNRSVADIVRAALQEDADGIAVSSYQGGHVEYFKYMVDMLKQADAAHIRIVVGGGGTIVPHEIEELEAYGVEKVYSPDDGMRMGLAGMIEDVFARVRRWQRPAFEPRDLTVRDQRDIGRTISLIEHGDERTLAPLRERWKRTPNCAPVIGVTGTGGAGKSSLNDELLNRFRRAFPERDVAVVAVDPTRRRTGGALLGDRIRMNSLGDAHIYMRSVATRREHLATSPAVADTLQFLRHCGFGLIVLETAGIGQSDTEVIDLVDYSVYVMTSEFGAASQLEKIGMLDYADLVAINKAEKRGAKDALRDVRKQWKRNRLQFKIPDEQLPVYLTIASQFNDPGVNRMFKGLVAGLVAKLKLDPEAWRLEVDFPEMEVEKQAIVPAARARYLAEIAETGRKTHGRIAEQARAASAAQACWRALEALADPLLPPALEAYPLDGTAAAAGSGAADSSLQRLRARYGAAQAQLEPASIQALRDWPARAAAARTAEYSYPVRGREVKGANFTESLSQLKLPKLGLPRFSDWGDQLRWLLEENLPGHYPYTAGVYPYRRTAEDPARMFAGEGTPERTNRRFHYVSTGQPATRLSTAFDSCTLYGEDPDERPDIYGRIGNSGVSIASVDDMKKLYSGFDLTAPTTSVSMTINGPAPIILAMYMNAAIDQAVERELRASGGWAAVEAKLKARRDAPRYQGELPRGHDGTGLGLLGLSGDQVVDAATYARIKAATLAAVRGTVQADILKEDQAQNTCIFSTDFALRMMGDVAEYFTAQKVRNFYSVSISGYHIAEAGANPISQLAFTLANGFTIVEYYLARGMKVDDFAPNLSFFFSNGMDPEYAVIGRVARRIWARAMKERYGADARSQMLKYHIQTSGRSLHAQEVQFNDIRTTLQALYALYDNCNSLHTNAYDEAITTPTEESVRRALAIQLIISKELGLNKAENPLSGSFVIDELTDLVEEAVYKEFEALSERGGVLGAMETMYQRGKIQEESLYYEAKKHDGSLPLVGVNTFKGAGGGDEARTMELIRSTEAEKRAQIEAIESLRRRGADRSAAALAELAHVASSGGNLFEALMETVKVCSLGQISATLYSVGGRYRRNM